MRRASVAASHVSESSAGFRSRKAEDARFSMSVEELGDRLTARMFPGGDTDVGALEDGPGEKLVEERYCVLGVRQLDDPHLGHLDLGPPTGPLPGSATLSTCR